MKRNRMVVAMMAAILLLLGVQRTPEAQVGEAITLAAGVIAIGGCVHMVATAKPDMTPMELAPIVLPPVEQ